MVQEQFWKNAFLTHFSPIFVPKWPIFKAFGDFPWAKTCHHGLKTGLKHLVLGLFNTTNAHSDHF